MKDLNSVIIGLVNKFLVFFRVSVLHRFYCILFPNYIPAILNRVGFRSAGF